MNRYDPAFERESKFSFSELDNPRIYDIYRPTGHLQVAPIVPAESLKDIRRSAPNIHIRASALQMELAHALLARRNTTRLYGYESVRR